MTAQILLGNGIFFLGAVILMSLGLVRTKRMILIAQIVQEVLMGIGMLILGGISGFIVDMVAIVRNLVCIRWKYTLKWKLVFIALQVGLYAAVGSEGFYGWMPVLAMALFTWFLDTDNVVLLKALIGIMQLMFLIYDSHIRNYVGIAVDITSMVTCVIGIIRTKSAQP